MTRPVKISACVLPGLVTTGDAKPCQDSFSYTYSDSMLLVGIFDGHGPHGEVVSSHSSIFISDYFLSHTSSFLTSPKETLISMLEECDKSLFSLETDQELSGSTAVVLLLQDDSIHTASLGDSRAILGTLTGMSFMLPPPRSKYCRTWPVGRVLKPIPLTIDQKPNHAEEFLRIRNAGGCVERVRDINGNNLGPFRVWVKGEDFPGLAMSRSLGDRAAKRIGVISTPIYHYFTRYHETDQFIVMASDGVWDVFDCMEVVNFVEKFRLGCKEGESSDSYPASCDNSAIARLLCEEARYRWFALVEGEDVHIDDITCVVIDYGNRAQGAQGEKRDRNVNAFKTLASPNEYVPEADGLGKVRVEV